MSLSCSFYEKTTTKDNIRMDFSFNGVGQRLGGVSDMIDALGF